MEWLAMLAVACGGSMAGLDAGGRLDSGGRDSGHDAGRDAGPCVARDGGRPAMQWADAGVDASTPFGARDILATALTLDLAARHGTARIDLAPSATSTGVRLEAGGLTIESVSDGSGPIAFDAHDGVLDVPLAPGSTSITVQYGFPARDPSGFDGWMPASPSRGVTFLWPYYCGNLFPCHSDPADGLRFTLDVQGLPLGATAVFPASLPIDAPSYMIAVAVDDRLAFHDLGTTAAGTHVGVYAFDTDATRALAGTAHLRDAFDFYERTLGPYRFGDRVASVEADWGPSGYGGMEHHPFWHVGGADVGSELTHVHEAAHGWYGDGVRLRCWEDFVLSEGTVSYLAARALEQTGAASADSIWRDYQSSLTSAIARGDTRAYPPTCDAIDIAHDRLWSDIPYMKGAFFYRAVEQRIGRPALDRVLREFYLAHVGEAATMQQMIDSIEDSTCTDVGDLADAWLRGLGDPGR